MKMVYIILQMMVKYTQFNPISTANSADLPFGGSEDTEW